MSSSCHFQVGKLILVILQKLGLKERPLGDFFQVPVSFSSLKNDNLKMKDIVKTHFFCSKMQIIITNL